jgi:hypothetical protein
VRNFHRRFKEFLREFDQDIPAPTTLHNLLQVAISAQKETMAWENTVKAIRSDEFKRSLECVRADRARFKDMRKLLQRDPKRPSWLSSWEQPWIAAFEGMEEHIQSQLKGAEEELANLSALAKFGRTQVESQVLLIHAGRIRELIAGTPLSRTPSVVLAAFAYAAQLVHTKDHANDWKGRYVEAIKGRLKHAKRSRAQREIVMTLYIASL